MKVYPVKLKISCGIDEVENESVAKKVAEHFKDCFKVNTTDLTNELMDLYQEAEVERYAFYNEGQDKSKPTKVSMYMGSDDDHNSLNLELIIL